MKNRARSRAANLKAIEKFSSLVTDAGLFRLRRLSSVRMATVFEFLPTVKRFDRTSRNVFAISSGSALEGRIGRGRCIMDTKRQEARSPRREVLSISWIDANGITRAADVQSVDTSDSGVAFTSAVEIPVGTSVYIDANNTSPACYSLVRHCNWNGDGYTIGVELETRQPPAKTEIENHYEFLQISPAAQTGTIHRVYRYLAGLYHPDNPKTGDQERFLQLNRAYSLLSNPKRRALYDAELSRTRNEPIAAFTGVDFMDGVEGELNRRLAVLAVLYRKSRSNINDPRVTLVELEKQMGFPREYLDFTTWYLRSKKYIVREDNSDFALTASGVDYVEENYAKIPLLRRMLSSGASRESRAQSEAGKPKTSQSPQPLILPGSREDAENLSHEKDHSSLNATDAMSRDLSSGILQD
jgi:curved DNA-binding protein CbpA